VPFGYKTAWFAIRSEDTNAVAIALELQNVYPANWEYGVWRAVESDEYSIFVTPSVNGWTLAVGVPILFEADDHVIERMKELSRRFGRAQFFASMRTSNCYIWARAANGNLVRQFYEGDGERRELGERTEEEEALGVRFFDASSPESNDPQYWKRKDLVFVDEECVLKIARKWSVDPSKLGDLGLAPSLGLLGKPSASYPPRPEPLARKQRGLIRRMLGR
jgi:hypothetical protein